MANGWSPARQAAQRAAVYRWRPWEKSTGPRSKVGKDRVAKNAWKHGHRSRAAREYLAEMRELLDELRLDRDQW